MYTTCSQQTVLEVCAHHMQSTDCTGSVCTPHAVNRLYWKCVHTTCIQQTALEVCAHHMQSTDCTGSVCTPHAVNRLYWKCVHTTCSQQTVLEVCAHHMQSLLQYLCLAKTTATDRGSELLEVNCLLGRHEKHQTTHLLQLPFPLII